MLHGNAVKQHHQIEGAITAEFLPAGKFHPAAAFRLAGDVVDEHRARRGLDPRLVEAHRR